MDFGTAQRVVDVDGGSLESLSLRNLCVKGHVRGARWMVGLDFRDDGSVGWCGVDEGLWGWGLLSNKVKMKKTKALSLIRSDSACVSFVTVSLLIW